MRCNLLQIEHPNRMNLDTFCEMYDIGIVVTEQAHEKYQFLAEFTEVDYDPYRAYCFSGARGGAGDWRCGGGDTPEGAVQNLVAKVAGRVVIATRSARKVEIPPLTLCELIPSERGKVPAGGT
jgi:hypothetical protein